MSRTRQQYEESARYLIGKRLAAVRYFEVESDTPEPGYQVPGFPGHLLDFGCDLVTDDGKTCGFMWDGEFFQYGVGVEDSSLSLRLRRFRSWDVSCESHWKGLAGRCVVSVDVYWDWAQYEGQAREYFPQDVAIGFDCGSIVYVCSSRYDHDKDKLSGMSDDIAVVFGDFAARRYGIGPYARRR